MTEWLQSGDSQATAPMPSGDSGDVEDSGIVATDKPVRAEKLEQKDRIQELIFAEKPMDTMAIEEYLEELFSAPDAKAALEKVREKLERTGEAIRKPTVTPWELKKWLIGSLLNRGDEQLFVSILVSNDFPRHPFCGEGRDTQRVFDQ